MFIMGAIASERLDFGQNVTGPGQLIFPLCSGFEKLISWSSSPFPWRRCELIFSNDSAQDESGRLYTAKFVFSSSPEIVLPAKDL